MYRENPIGSIRIIIGTILFVALYNILLLTYLSPYINPKNFWWISIIGLAYPITSILSFLVLIFVFWRKWTIRYTLLFFFLLGTPLHIRYFAWSFGNSPEDLKKQENSIRLMSYNVRLFDFYEQLDQDRKITKTGIFKLIEEIQPDILCFQEYLLDKSARPHVTDKELNELGGFIAKYDNNIWEYRDRYFGIATFSKLPIVGKGSLNTEFDDRFFGVYTDHVKNEDTFRVYNVHLQSIKFQQEEYEFFSDSLFMLIDHKKTLLGMVDKIRYAYAPRVDQTEAILAHAKKSPYPVIIAGDFNDTPMSYVYSKINQDFYDAFRQSSSGIGATYAGKVPAGRIDYIWHDENFKTNSFSVVKEVLSDHYPIWSDIKLLR